MAEAIIIGSIITSILAGLGAIAIIFLYIIYRCTGGRRAFCGIFATSKLFNSFWKANEYK